MAQFLLQLGPGGGDPYWAETPDLCGLWPGLAPHLCAGDDFALHWALAPQAPCDLRQTETGVTLLIGYALADTGGRLSAADLAARPRGTRSSDGFFVAIDYDSRTGLRIETDLLGAFPVYYAKGDGALWVASSPTLLEPALGGRVLDLEGMVGVLLCSFAVNGRTLAQGVTRLSAGHALHWDRATGLSEVRTLPPLLSRRHFYQMFSGQVRVLGDTLAESLAAHIDPSRTGTMLLTGGRDSRALAGLLAERGLEMECLTFGLRSDCDVELAAEIAQRFGWKHCWQEVDFEQLPLWAETVARWEHGAISLNSALVWGEAQLLRRAGPEVLVGHMASSVLGGAHIADAFGVAADDSGFETLLGSISVWGLAPAEIVALLRDPYAADLVAHVIARLRVLFDTGEEDNAAQRAWRFDLFHRQRSMLGGALWRYSFAAWPVVPMASLALLQAAGGMPPASLAERRAQDELLFTRFPALSGVPIDQVLRTLLEGRHWAHLRRLRPQIAPRQRVERASDIDGVHWRHVRGLAEAGRDRACDVLNADALARLLPPPDCPIGGDIYRWSGRKALLEVLLWLREI